MQNREMFEANDLKTTNSSGGTTQTIGKSTTQTIGKNKK